MKYIKNFEELSSDQIKKYLVVSSDEINKRMKDIEYFIVKVLEINGNELKVIKKITYKRGEFINHKNDKVQPFNMRIQNSLLDIIYTSDDIDDCINMIKIKIDVNKYNL